MGFELELELADSPVMTAVNDMEEDDLDNSIDTNTMSCLGLIGVMKDIWD